MSPKSTPVQAGPARLSRLRVRLASAFTVTFVIALALVALGSLGWLMHESTRRLDARLTTLAASVARAIALEKEEYPDSSLAAIVDDVQREWVIGPDSWIVLDSSGMPVSATTDPTNRVRVLKAWRSSDDSARVLNLDDGGDDLRVISVSVPPTRDLPEYTILAVASTEPLERDTELLTLAMAIATPLIVLFSLLGGYLLSRWALRPTETLGDAIDRLGPTAVGGRLPVSKPPDEIGQLAQRFNALLDRLAISQAQNREFVREAAHQIRTPLTLVRGEAELALSTSSPQAGALREALARIERASRQMQRRVDELLLLAEAEAGTRLEQRAPVELDSRVVDGVDLFRARAAQFGQPIAYGVLEPATVMGDQPLLDEALMELLENACRHGRTDTSIVVSVRVRDDVADLVVESHRTAVLPNGIPASKGLGQRIVRWIAEVHDGQFSVEHNETGRYAAVLTLPVVPTSRSAGKTGTA